MNEGKKRTTRREKELLKNSKAKEIRDKLKKLNPSLYNRETGKRLRDRLKGVPGTKKPRKPSIVPGGPFKPENKKNPVPGGPFIPGKGPKFSKPMTSKGGPTIKGEKRKRPKKFNLGGEAQTGLGRATVRKSQTEAQRKRVDDMLKRLYGPKIKPKPKPKNPNRIKPKKKPINPKTRKPKGIGFKGKRD